MKKQAAVLLYSLIFGLPLMLGFQNCAKTQQFEVTDISGLTNSSMSIDTGNLPQNETIPVVQPGAPSQQQVNQEMPPSDSGNMANGSPDSGSSSGGSMPEAPSSGGSSGSDMDDDHDVSYQVEDPEKEDRDDIAQAKYDCEHLSESANVDGVVIDNDGVVKSRGNHVFSPADFANHDKIKRIDNAYGKVVLCDLEVDSYSSSGGKLIVIRSHIKNLNTFRGKVHVVGDSTVLAGN